MKKQLFTFDRAIILILFICFVVLIQSFLFIGEEKLRQDAESAIAVLTDEDNHVSVLTFNEVDVGRVLQFEDMDYTVKKKELGIDSDFCIYFEDSDGSAIQITDEILAMGSSKIQVNGKPCT